MKKYKVISGEWEDYVEVDEGVFDTHESQSCEAIASSIEKWASDEDDESCLNPHFCVAKAVGETGEKEKLEDNDWVMSTEVVFSDIGRMDLIKILNEEIRRHKHDE
jgi:hypothetical protein